MFPYSEFFWPVFSRIWTEYGEIPRVSPYAVRKPKKTGQKNSKYGQFSRVFSKHCVYYVHCSITGAKNQIVYDYFE